MCLVEESKEVSMTDTTTRGAGPAERADHAGGDGPAPERRRRMSARRKQSAVESCANCAAPGRGMNSQRGVSQLWTATKVRKTFG